MSFSRLSKQTVPRRPRRSSACLLPATPSWRRAKLTLLHMVLFSNVSLVFEVNALLSVVFINTRLTHTFFIISNIALISVFLMMICVFCYLGVKFVGGKFGSKNNNLKITLN